MGLAGHSKPFWSDPQAPSEATGPPRKSQSGIRSWLTHTSSVSSEMRKLDTRATELRECPGSARRTAKHPPIRDDVVPCLTATSDYSGGRRHGTEREGDDPTMSSFAAAYLQVKFSSLEEAIADGVVFVGRLRMTSETHHIGRDIHGTTAQLLLELRHSIGVDASIRRVLCDNGEEVSQCPAEYPRSSEEIRRRGKESTLPFARQHAVSMEWYRNLRPSSCQPSPR